MVSAPTRVSPLAMLLGVVFMLSSHVLAASAVMGVDLGTEYIKASLVKPGVPLDVVLTKDSRRKEASAVAFKPSKGGPQEGSYPERLYGSDAMALAARFPGEVYPNLKALLGLSASDPVAQDYAARHPSLQLESHPTLGTAQFKTNTMKPEEEAWLVEELLAMELQNVQKNAEAAAGDGSTVRSVVMTVPPFYTTEEKRAIESAAALAGLNVLSLISDGLAVGLNYATTRQFPNINEGAKPEYHMVFDMGAGSTTASILKFQSRSVKDIGKFNKTIQEVQLMGAGWDRTLGGDALSNLIVDDMIAQFVESKGAKKIDATAEGVRAHGRAVAKLTKEAQRVRHVLSANQNTQAGFEGLYEDVDFKYKITRAEFEALAEAHAERIGSTIKDALKMSGLDIADLGSIILHGGATRTPFVQKALEKAIGSADKLRSNVNSDEAAVFGAGFRAAGLSPSFRVKEIRILEGPAYPVGTKWTNSNGKKQTQRLWSPISPLGGAAKEFTFNEEKDFSVSFYQQVGAEQKDVKLVTTKNLTETVDLVKANYPSCVESGIYFRIGAKLKSEDGEVDIVKAAVECEAEAKETFVDGVKNLFGFGKKDQEVLKDGEAATAETETVVGSEETTSEEADSSSATEKSDPTKSASADAAASSSAGSAEGEAKKTELISIPVEFAIEKLGTPELSSEDFAKAKDRLRAFAISDKARVQREEALNRLEGFTYKVRDMVEDEGFIAASTDAERTKLSEMASATSEWLYDDGADASKDELKSKLRELQDLVSPIQKRKDEAEKRPGQVKLLTDVLDQTANFIETNRKKIDEFEAWEQSPESSSQGGDETEDGVEDAPEAPSSPEPPLYARDELDSLEELSKTTREWLQELQAKQDSLPATTDPVLLVKDITSRRQVVETTGQALSMRGRMNSGAKGKKSSKSKKSGSGSGSKTASADPADNTIKIGDKVYTAEDLEELVKNMGEGGWRGMHDNMANMVYEEAERKKKEQEKAEDDTHDEL